MNIPLAQLVNTTGYEQVQAVYGSPWWLMLTELCFGSFHDGPRGSALWPFPRCLK